MPTLTTASKYAAKFQDPEPSKLSKDTVDGIASNIARAVGYEPGADLGKIVEKLGGELLSQAWDEATEGGSLEVYPGRKPRFLLRISPFAGALRNRFTIAHELGHYFLHSGVGTKAIKVMREGSDRVEWEANWFAAGFLLPAARFKSDWRKAKGDIGKLINLYQVSEFVIQIRQEYLKLR